MYATRSQCNGIFISRTGSIDCKEAGLVSVKGAKDIIAAICTRSYVSQLILSHNALGDDGSAFLFEFLASGPGRKYRIGKISVNSNGIGDKGLAAVSRYLEHNKGLTELFLHNNNFTCTDPSLASSFATALNSSSVEVLIMSTNIRLSDSFAANFLPNLHSESLKELHLSAMGMTPRAVPSLVDYISSARCRLHTLKMNGNSLGFRGVRAIIRAIKRHNYSLTSVEVWSNTGPASELDSSDITPEEEDDMPGTGTWQENDKALKPLLFRNDQLGRMARREALSLLKISRTLLLPCRQQTPSPNTFPFIQLPVEMQLYLLSFLSPTLSAAQRTRIYDHASSLATLPTLLLFPQSKVLRDLSHLDFCLRDPGTLSFGVGHSSCLDGKCLGSSNHLTCSQQESKMRWLAAVGCLFFEPEVEAS